MTLREGVCSNRQRGGGQIDRQSTSYSFGGVGQIVV